MSTMIPLSDIQPSPTNPRARMDKQLLAELVASVKTYGVLSPVLVRPAPPREKGSALPQRKYELVYGHRRFAACEDADLTTIPAEIKDLSDQEALEIQLVENKDREDIHPLDEAEAYQRLHESFKLGVDDIAVKVGKSRAYVYGRIQLTKLPSKAKKAFLANEITPSVAMLFARIPDAQIAAAAFDECLKHYKVREGDGLTVRVVDEVIERDFLLRLKEAPFKTSDANLVPKAGPCSTCPKRTGNQPELFGDVKNSDLCTDRRCFAAKRDAAWAQIKAKAEEDGLVVLDDKKAAVAMQSHEYVELDQQDWSDPKHRTYRQILEKHKAEFSPVLCRGQRTLKPTEIIKRSEIQSALRAAGVKGPAVLGNPQAAKAAREAKAKAAASRAALEAVMKKVEKAPATTLWPIAEIFMIRRPHNDVGASVCSALGIKRNKEKQHGYTHLESPFDAIERWISGHAKGEQAAVRRNVAFRMVLASALPHYQDKFGAEMLAAAKLLKVDVDSVFKRTRAEALAAAKQKSKSAKGSKSTGKKRRVAPLDEDEDPNFLDDGEDGE